MMGAPTDENLRVLRCPMCQNEDIKPEAAFCKICGLEVINLCSGEQYYDFNEWHIGNQHPNDSNARFCTYCGRETVFYQKGILKPWDKVEEG